MRPSARLPGRGLAARYRSMKDTTPAATSPDAPTVAVRRAHEGDKRSIVRLLHRSWETTWKPRVTAACTRRYYETEHARRFVATVWRGMIVADLGGALVGMVHTLGDQVTALHVDPDHRRRGIGRLLMDRAEREIAERGYRAARLETDDFNLVARAFYAGRGYVEVRRYPDTEYESGVTTLELRKDLTTGVGTGR